MEPKNNFTHRWQNPDSLSRILRDAPGYFKLLHGSHIATALTTNSQSIHHHDLRILIESSTAVFHCFPAMKETDRMDAIEFLGITFLKVESLDDIMQKEYFHSVFYRGLAISCDTAMYIDVQLQKELQSTSKPAAAKCYKDYVQLWVSLFKTEENEESQVKKIFGEFALVLTETIDGLNLRVKKSKPERKVDYRRFLNLVDLGVEIFHEMDPLLLDNNSTLESLLLCFVRNSYKYPTISGFYKLVRAIFKRLGIKHHFEDCLSKGAFGIVSKFLSDVVLQVNEKLYTDELRLSCICLIFNSPLVFVNYFISEVLPVLSLALEIGQNDTGLAFMALEVLDVWCTDFDNNASLIDFRKNIVVQLQPYLAFNLEDLHVDGDEKCKLESLQKKMLLFIGAADSKKVEDLVHEACCQSSSSSIIWEKRRPQLSCNFSFGGERIELQFDNLIAPTLELVEKCKNRRERFAACELLHSLVTIVLGKKRALYKCLDKRLCFAVLRLSCDTDDAFRNLFHPLVVQLARYLSGNKFLDSSVSQQFVDLLFEGMLLLLDESRPHVHLYFAACLREFVKQVVKPGANDGAKQSNFMNRLIHRIQNFALYPENGHGIAAATAFNCLYSILDANTGIVSIYWLQFLYAFVKCHEHHCHHPEIVAAIENVASTIKNKSSLLFTTTTNDNKNKGRRKVPTEFVPSERPSEAVTSWLLGQCGSVNPKHRHKCMELFENLCPFLSEHKNIQQFFDSNCLRLINGIALKDLDNCADVLSSHSANAFLRSLDFYIWIFNKRSLSPESVFVVEKEEEGRDVFFKFYAKFIRVVISRESSTMQQVEELADLTSKVVLKIFRFISLVLVSLKVSFLKYNEATTVLLENLWSDDFCTFVALFALCPPKIGLTAKALRFIEPKQLENWFEIAMKKLPENALYYKLKDGLYAESLEHCKNLTNFDDIVAGTIDVVGLTYYVRGITTLETCEFCNFREQIELPVDGAKEKIEAVLGILEKTKDVEIVNYLNDTLRYLLLQYDSSLVRFLAKKMMPDPSRSEAERKRVFETLKAPVFQLMLKRPIEALREIEALFADGHEVGDVLRLIEELVSFARQHTSVESRILAGQLIDDCKGYRALIGESEPLKDRFFKVYRMVIELRDENVAATPSYLYECVLDELYSESCSIERKLELLDGFFAHMVAEGGDTTSSSLKRALHQLWATELGCESRATRCLGCLARLLAVTRSPVALEITVDFVTAAAVGISGLLERRRLDDSLRDYLDALEPEGVLASLKLVFSRFVDRSLGWVERLYVLRYVLVPMLAESTDESTRSSFFECNIREIGESGDSVLVREIQEERNVDERRNAMVTRMGFFEFAQLSAKRFECVNPTSRMFFDPASPNERELARLLNCATLNYLVSLADDESISAIRFAMLRQDTRSLWEQIIDCERLYDVRTLPETSSERPVHVCFATADERTTDERVLESYLNDNYFPDMVDRRRGRGSDQNSIVLEDDEPNEHECMPALVALWTYLVESGTIKKPTSQRVDGDEREEKMERKVCLWIECFRRGLLSSENNVALFVLRLLGNAKEAFLPFTGLLFADMARALILLLEKAASWNYVIRDGLAMIIESKVDPGANEGDGLAMAQELVERLIDRLAVDQDPEVYAYNAFLLEELIHLWSDKLKVFGNLEATIDANADVAMRVLLAMLKHGVACDELMKSASMHEFVRDRFFGWRDPMVERTYETFGLIMKLASPVDRDLLRGDVLDMLEDMEKIEPHPLYESKRDCCVRLLYMIYKSCPSIADNLMIKRFLNPRTVSQEQRKIECLEMLLALLLANRGDKKNLLDILETMDLPSMMNERFLPCHDVVLEALDASKNLLSPKEVKPHLVALEQYTRPGKALAQHRRSAYRIFTDIYLKCAADTECEETKALTKMCEKVLANGITDPSDLVQGDIIAFWHERSGLPSDPVDRLTRLLKMYSPELDSNFAQLLSCLMLESTRTDDDRNSLFAGLREQEDLRDYEVATPSLRSRFSKLPVPLYAPSLVRRLEEAIVVQDIDFPSASSSPPPPQTNLGRAIVEKLTRTNETRIDTSSTRKAPPSRRDFAKEADTPSPTTKYYEEVIKEVSELSQSVKVNRRYRIGKVPDVEITRTDVVVTLRDLALKDRRFASQLAVQLVCAVARHLKPDTKTYADLIDEIAITCNRALRADRDFAYAAMELLHRLGCIDFDADAVAKQAGGSLNSQISGILLLERDSLDCEQFIYDAQKIPINPNLRHGAKLIGMYRSIGERDVVQSILKNWTNSLDSVELCEGYSAEQAGDWTRAAAIYERMTKDGDRATREFCEEGIYKCLSELSDWAQLDKKLRESLGDHKVWNHPRREDILPWMFKSQTQNLMEGTIPNARQFFEDAAAEIARGQTDLQKKFGLELTTFHLCRGDEWASERSLRSYLDHAREQWTSSSGLAVESRLQLLAALGRACDAGAHLKTLCKFAMSNSALVNLVEYWKNVPPESCGGQDLCNWSMRVACRLGFSRFLRENLDDGKDEESAVNSVAIEILLDAEVKQRLKISEIALDRGVREVLDRQGPRIERALRRLDPVGAGELFPELLSEYNIVTARRMLLDAEGEVTSNVRHKFKHCVDSWRLADREAVNEKVDVATRNKAKQLVVRAMRALQVLLRRDPKHALLLALSCSEEHDFVASSLGTQNPNELERRLGERRLELLRSVDAADSLLTLADHYRELLLGSYQRTSQVQLEYARAVLSAMAYGSSRADRYFFDLLDYQAYEDRGDVVELFVDKSRDVPTRAFLRCSKEILSSLDAPARHHRLRDTLIVPIVERLADEFPRAIAYKLHEVCRVLDHRSYDGKKEADKITDIHGTVVDSSTESFFRAMEFLIHPEQYLKSLLSDLIAANKRSAAAFARALKALVDEIHSDADSKSLRGPMFQRVLEAYSEKLREWTESVEVKQLPAIVKNLCAELDDRMRGRLRANNTLEPLMLHSYSPFLAEFPFDKTEIPVPGLEENDKLKIAKIDSFVEIVWESKRCSLKVDVLATNGKTYSYLVKHGKDMRQDEWVQQLFRYVNETLRSDSRCAERHLLVKSYCVLPMNERLSLVQWVSGAKSLRELVEHSLAANKRSILEDLSLEYRNWIGQADTESKSPSKCHRQALLCYFPDQVRDKLKKLTERLDWDLLRQTFVKISSSIECFFKLRQNFTRCYGVLCAVDWIVGVGDRRPENILVDVSSGRCFGLDYQMIFGAAIDQPVPELTPFRLTAQILGLLRPFTARDALAATMSHALAALRQDKSLILIYLNMLLRCSLKWDRLVEERWLEDCNQYKGAWIPKFKYDIAESKLSGDEPTGIMIRELSVNHGNMENCGDQYLLLYKSILSGNDVSSISVRVTVTDEKVTPEQQVLCLVDQATDVNILGRMCVEWCPYI